MKLVLKIIFSLFFVLSIYNCSSTRYLSSSLERDNKYDTEFPAVNGSAEINRISKSVIKFFTTAYYVNYHFDREDHLTIEDIPGMNLAKKSHLRSYFTKNASGTATLISKSPTSYLFITCNHVLAYPDTIYYYFTNSEGALTDTIRSVAIKVRQSNQIPGFGEAVLVARDEEKDIALIGYIKSEKLIVDRSPMLESIQPLRIPWGNPDDLQWGSFVYIIGYPQGMKMLTKGLVSLSDTPKGKKILIDALFNPGASGALVLAIRDGIPNLELVGIANAVAADDEYYLIPEKGKEWDPTVEYRGKSYVRHRKLINYGITFIIPVDEIKDFITRNSEEIDKKGFMIPDIFKPVPGKP